VDHAIEVFIGFSYYIWVLGAVGVCLFVFVSGFLAKESNGKHAFNPKEYLLKRFVKLFPLYLLACLLQYAFLAYPVEFQVTRLFMVNAAHLWFVPMILLMYGLFVVYKAYPRVFPLAVAVYILYYVGVTVGCLWVGDWNGVFTVGLYWLILLGVFFSGVKCKALKWKLPSNPLISLVSSYSYPIYLFQYPFIFAIQGVGLVTGLTYVGLALLVFVCAKMELTKR
jgi:peptidoglycan/LPS O-acetylase OafA/YrhL